MKQTIGSLIMLIIILIVIVFFSGDFKKIREYKLKSLEPIVLIKGKIYSSNTSHIRVESLNSRYKVGDTILIDKYYVIIEKY